MAEGGIDRVLITLGAVAGTTGLLLLWQDAQRWRKVHLLAEQLSSTKLELDAAEERLKQRDTILGPHHDRVRRSKHKHQQMLDYCSQSDDPEDRKNIPEFEDRLRRLDTALEKMVSSFMACQTARDDLHKRHTELSAELVALTQTSTAAADHSSEPSQISERFFLPEWLEQLEADGAMFDDMMAEGEADELEDDGDQITRLKFELNDLRDRKHELQALEASADVDAELNHTNNRLAEVLTALNLYGFTICDDRVVLDGDSDDESAVPLSPITQPFINEDNSDDAEQLIPQSPISPIAQVPMDPCVFDWSEFERPEDRNYGYDEPVQWVTEEEAKSLQVQHEREYQEHLEKNNNRILTWLQNVTSDPPPTDDQEANDETTAPTGLEHLREIEVGEWCFDEYEIANLSKSEINMRQTQIAAIFRISRQRFREGVQADLVNNPDTTVPYDWQEYVERTYEVSFGDSNSTPWI